MEPDRLAEIQQMRYETAKLELQTAKLRHKAALTELARVTDLNRAGLAKMDVSSRHGLRAAERAAAANPST